MAPGRQQHVKTIFEAALQCSPSSQAALLRDRCGDDDELRREVESMLAFYKPADPHAPLTLTDRYEIERELGRGGMSVVYLARDRQLLEKRVVIKVLLDESSIDPWIRQKFLQEMEALSRIEHPGVVGVLDTGLTPDCKQFLVMQYIEGRTLRAVIEPRGVNPARAASLIRQIAQALAAAHEKGVWHRDLKPENIMV